MNDRIEDMRDTADVLRDEGWSGVSRFDVARHLSAAADEIERLRAALEEAEAVNAQLAHDVEPVHD